jgi:hypothetical protein
MSFSPNKKFGGKSNGNEPRDLVTSDVFIANHLDGIVLSLHGSL